jgi:hypothetical protein
MGNEINEVINNICDRLGILATELIPEMGKMKVAELGCACGIAIVILLVAVAMLIAGMKKNEKHGISETGDALEMVGGFLIVAAVIALICFIPDFVGWLASPKAKTLTYVLGKIGGSV